METKYYIQWTTPVENFLLSSYPLVDWNGRITENGELSNVRTFTENAAKKALDKIKENPYYDGCNIVIKKCTKVFIPARWVHKV